MQTVDPEQIVGAFEESRDAYLRFEGQLKTLLIDLIQDKHIQSQAIESRTKEVSSLREKLLRPGKSYDSLHDVPDLCGVRIVVYYQEDIERVADVLRTEFAIDDRHTSYAVDRLLPDQFGYVSLHLVLRLSESRADLSEWRHSKNLCAEVQLRTAVQHAWAGVSHGLQYKREDDPPAPLKRRLARLAGLLELADEEFQSLRKLHEGLAFNNAHAVTAGALDVTIDSASVSTFLRVSDTAKKITEASVIAGFTRFSGHGANPYVSDLTSLLIRLGIKSLAEFDQLLRPVEGALFSNFLEAYRAAAPWRGGSDAFFAFLALCLAAGDKLSVEMLVELDWSNEAAHALTYHAKRFHADL